VRAPAERTLLVGVELTARRRSPGPTSEEKANAEEPLEELAALAESAGAHVVGRVTQMRSSLDAATLLGSVKVE